MTFFKRLFGKRRRNSKFIKLEKRIGYRFSNSHYLEQAFTHRSMEFKPRENYERLEFLGDAVIDLVISEALMEEFPEGDEGILTQKRSALVQKSFLSDMGVFDVFKNGQLVVHEKIAEKQSGNVYEALIGAIYMDGGFVPCQKIILDSVWRHRADAWKTTNYKGRLIEYCHSNRLENPKFCIASVSGPEHQKLFEVYIKIGAKSYRPGLGSNKKAAEQTAAQIAIEELI